MDARGRSASSPASTSADDPAFKGREARAHGAGLRLFVEAPPRPEDALAEFGDLRRPTRGRPRGHRQGREDRSLRLRCRDCGAARKRSLYDRAHAPRSGLHIARLISRAAALGAVAREVVEAYGDTGGRVMEHPVGTGPFRLVDWRRAQKIVLEANTGYREELFPAPPPDADAAVARQLRKSMAGKRLPRVGRVELSIIEPPQPLLLAFNSGATRHHGSSVRARVQGTRQRQVACFLPTRRRAWPCNA